jgi:hypothetical protein
MVVGYSDQIPRAVGANCSVEGRKLLEPLVQEFLASFAIRVVASISN